MAESAAEHDKMMATDSPIVTGEEQAAKAAETRRLKRKLVMSKCDSVPQKVYSYY